MGDMTFVQLQDELKFTLGNRNDITATGGADPDRLKRWLNWTYRYMCLPGVRRHREVESQFDITLATTVAAYNIDGTAGFHMVDKPRHVTYYDTTGAITDLTTRRQVRPRNLQALQRRGPGSGPPSFYDIRSGDIVFDPVPTSAETGRKVRVFCWKQPAALVNNGDLTILSAYYDLVLVTGAKWQAQFAMDYLEQAELTKQVFMSLLNEQPDAGTIRMVEEVGFTGGVETGGNDAGLF